MKKFIIFLISVMLLVSCGKNPLLSFLSEVSPITGGGGNIGEEVIEGDFVSAFSKSIPLAKSWSSDAKVLRFDSNSIIDDLGRADWSITFYSNSKKSEKTWTFFTINVPLQGDITTSISERIFHWESPVTGVNLDANWSKWPNSKRWVKDYKSFVPDATEIKTANVKLADSITYQPVSYDFSWIPIECNKGTSYYYDLTILPSYSLKKSF
ncbi:MAG: hypothetical protein ABH873_03520 [Candidatus Firestonebacteria bacterium]